MHDNQRRPGEAIIDFYMPDASPAEREEALHDLRAFVEVIAKIAKVQPDIVLSPDSPESGSRCRIPSLPQPL